MKIDIAMTATRRPEIIRRTLESFVNNLFGTTDNLRLIINIDPIGLPINSLKVVDVVREYFDDIVYNLPEKADFNTAFRHVLSSCRSDFVFHLQDDWEAMYPIDFDKMVEILTTEKDLALLRLSMFASEKDRLVNWDTCSFPWNGNYFECPYDKQKRFGFCGHPSLIKRKFLDATVPLMNRLHNPENQFHTFFKIVEQIDNWRYGVFIDPDSPPNVTDIGREWMIQNKWLKNSDKTHTVWHPGEATPVPAQSNITRRRPRK